MRNVESVLQSHGKYIDIVVSALVLVFFAYTTILLGQLLLATTVSILLLTVYIPLRQEKHAHVLPIILGWIIGVYGYFSSNQLAVGLILGLAVYIALMIYRCTDALIEPNETR
jgi:prepilin signal peptidase PulO-like enzyme (type II secretory pathway)